MPDEQIFPYGSFFDADPTALRVRASRERLTNAALAYAEEHQRLLRARSDGIGDEFPRLVGVGDEFLDAAAAHNLVTLDAIPDVPAECEVLYEVYCFEHLAGHRLCEDHACALRPSVEARDRARSIGVAG